MRFVSTSGCGPPASLRSALFDGLSPDGRLYVPASIDAWAPAEIAALPSMSLAEIGARVLRPFTAGEIDDASLDTLVRGALDFPMPLVEVEAGVRALELFHGPTLAFKDVGARVMARLLAALHDGGDPITLLVATSGDTGGAVAHAFHGVPHTRVAILYPDGGVSPTQEAQLTMFNGEAGGNVRAYAIAGTFDDCQRLVKSACADAVLRAQVRVSSANSINIGRLLPQMIYYFHAVARLMNGALPQIAFSTPSGNFGNLTAGLMAKRAGLPIASFVAATNANDVVPAYLETGRFEPRPSIATIANAMDCGNPSNFDRMMWLYGGNLDAMRGDVSGSRHDDGEVRATIRRVYEERGYLLDPHSAIAYLGVTRRARHTGRVEGAQGVFLATAHPAKFAEVVEPIIGRAIEKPAALAGALAGSRCVVRVDATLDAVRARVIAAT
jgi:threonine synthase